MISDANHVAAGAVLRPDVAVIGGGAAGITLARSLAGTSLSVLVLESGGTARDDASSALNRVKNAGAHYTVENSRERYFGGTTNHWTGYCRPIDADAFDGIAGDPFTRWPISRADLDPYYAQAQSIVQIGDAPFTADWLQQELPGFRLLFDDDRWQTVNWRISPPTRFGERYRDDLERAKNVRTLLYANVVNIVTTRDAGAVTALDVATLRGRRFTVEPGIAVLATGGLEVPRLLLASRDQTPAGVGNRNDLVGRCFMEHPHILGHGSAVLAAGVRVADAYTDGWLPPGTPWQHTHVLAGTTLRPEVRRAKGLLGCVFTLVPPKYDGSGPTEPGRAAVSSLVEDLRGLARPGVYGMNIRAEHYPNRDSRVTLTSRRDVLGVPTAKVTWNLTDREYRSITSTLDMFGRDLGRREIGRLRLPAERFNWDSSIVDGGYHHMGTTRMHEDPRSGVVDANLLVHGMTNLYIASSGVHTTSSYSNPTFTLVALTLRLADHLRRVAAGNA